MIEATAGAEDPSLPQKKVSSARVLAAAALDPEQTILRPKDPWHAHSAVLPEPRRPVAAGRNRPGRLN